MENGIGRTLCELPDELVIQTMGYLDAKSLLSMRSASQKFSQLASRNEAGWTNLCETLWKEKIFVGDEARTRESSMLSYRLSVEDAKTRHHLTHDELCFDLETKKGTVWSFRFKESAGPDWTGWDPWWNFNEANKMVFLRDGTVRQFIAKDNEQYDDVSSQDSSERVENGVIVDPPMTMSWRFASRPMDLPERPEGSYIRFSVGGRDVPTYVVRRSPTGNWGFLAESCWGVYTSFPMPKRVRDPRPSRLRLRRTQEGGRFVDIESDTDDEGGATRPPRRSSEFLASPLADDSTFVITNEVQWREALLYNFGATVLPEGESATDDFDRMFGQQLGARGG